MYNEESVLYLEQNMPEKKMYDRGAQNHCVVDSRECWKRREDSFP